MGLGRFGGGVGVARWLVGQGAKVTISDKESPESLAKSVAQLGDLDVSLHLGGHAEADFRQTDLVVVNPAVPDTSPFLAAARDARVPVTTEINLFVQRCRGRTVGVTGSVGKSTIAAMTAHVLERAAAARRVWLGGNIGRSLLDALPEIDERDVVVLELSSFQLQRSPAVGWSPHVAVISNVTPNHLDWHGTFAAYLAAKLNIVRFQDPARDAIVIEDAPELRQNFDLLFGDVAGVWRYGVDGAAAPQAVLQSTSAVDCDDRRLRWDGVELSVPGRHNRVNAAAALTAAHVLGADSQQAVEAIKTFAALPHRLQRVATVAGVTWFDDSKSTTPEAAITAMNAIDGPLLLILGGYDKKSDLTPVAQLAARRARFAACIGQTGEALVQAVQAAGGQAEYCGDLPRAVVECRRRACPGDAVLLSPACASWGQFEDYRARGELFARLAKGSAVD
ncbi:UDP-N-acetylmuramoylalanine--D-glutamate ligase MurD [Phycisphaerae bacterium RAS1]|nr:UDP-N-acetylmuramoylalanine--D-glutamate ligase MurD [Phycisphaerae bacterium RAS1]